MTAAEAQELRGGGSDAENVPLQPEETLQEFEVITPEAAAALQAFEQEHASEIATAEDKPFELTKEEPAPAACQRRARKHREC